MTPEEKKLLIKDLCARLPYGVKCYIKFDDGKIFDKRTLVPITIQDFKKHSFLSVTPYLRPMSDMSEDERKYITDKCGFTTMGPIGGEFALVMPVISTEWLTDFYNSHHIDWRGLIPMGLALEAKEGMYK